MNEFDYLVTEIETCILEAEDTQESVFDRGPGGRELALVKTKLQEALFWAKEAKRVGEEG